MSYGKGGHYRTDVISQEATDFIQARQSQSEPFFMYLAPPAPHNPASPGKKYSGSMPDVRAHRDPSFCEDDVSDKPGWIRSQGCGKNKVARIDHKEERRAETLQSVDDMVEAITDELSKEGKLDNTYLVFTSDNGYYMGEHRVFGSKNGPHEPSIKVPLGIRGPSIPQGRHTSQMALNIDLGPTFATLGGATVPDFVDGRPLTETFASDASSWRKRFLEEFWNAGGSKVPQFNAVRTDTEKYIEYTGGSKEYYDLTTDPYELESSPESAPSSLVDGLAALEACSGSSCRAAEDAS